jgi:hypothetical protein
MDRARREMKDHEEKLRSARERAAAPDATARDEADLKIIEQEATAQKLRMQREAGKAQETAKKDEPVEKKLDRKLDAALKDSFPGSDPVAFVEAAPVKPQDAALPEVKAGKK